jgi:hypothetical protein
MCCTCGELAAVAVADQRGVGDAGHYDRKVARRVSGVQQQVVHAVLGEERVTPREGPSPDHADEGHRLT